MGFIVKTYVPLTFERFPRGSLEQRPRKQLMGSTCVLLYILFAELGIIVIFLASENPENRGSIRWGKDRAP